MLDSARITSADVARVADVSRATVSYVLNDTPGQTIPHATRRRVLDAARRLGYAPSAAARALRLGRSDLVLVVLPDWPIGTKLGQVIEQLSSALAERRLTVVTHELARTERSIIDLWRSLTPAAVITFDALTPDEVTAMRAAGTVVAVAAAGNGTDGLATLNEQIGLLQVRHLAAAGHRRIGYAAPDDPRVDTFAHGRLEGVHAACAELGLARPAVRTVSLDSVEGAIAAVYAWRASSPPVTAVCAYNDEVALAVLAGARALGRAVPEDLAVVGVDDIPAARFAAPPLSTVAVDSAAIAAYLTSLITRRLAGDGQEVGAPAPLARLVARETT